MIVEAEMDEIALISKAKRSARRIRDPGQLEQVFAILGSNMNPILTQLAKTRRALFVEGKDFQILGKFARKLHSSSVANRANFAVIPIEGFSPERVRHLIAGIEPTLGKRVSTGVILDRDYRSVSECRSIEHSCRSFCDFAVIHSRKEIENFLLVSPAIDRAAAHRVLDRARRYGTKGKQYEERAVELLETFAEQKKVFVTSQHLAFRRQYERRMSSPAHEAEISQAVLTEIDEEWKSLEGRLALILR